MELFYPENHVKNVMIVCVLSAKLGSTWRQNTKEDARHQFVTEPNNHEIYENFVEGIKNFTEQYNQVIEIKGQKSINVKFIDELRKKFPKVQLQAISSNFILNIFFFYFKI